MKKISVILVCLLSYYIGFSLDNTYHYSIDLTKVSGRKLNVELTPPQLTESKIVFSFPKIVPGTYSINDFGRFVEDFKAFDAAGSPLPVVRIDTNSWEISNSATLARITYRVNDTYHPSIKSNPVFEPAGTDFEPDTCYILNLHAILGYFRGHTKQPYELNVTHQPAFYGSTSLIDRDNSNTIDRYQISNYNEVVDNPIMYTRPDTAHIRIGESDILISVYSPSKKADAKGISIQLDTLLQDQSKYLGGKLPVQKYSFLIYLANHEGLTGGLGALEHSYGSMYYLIDGPDSAIASLVRDVAAHEFFHIVTPLNIHSVEIADFDFDHPKMSEHLWLYEGSTEYHAHMVQVRYGLISQENFLDVIKEKMNEAMFGFNDSLSFTGMSRGCLDTFKDQYLNVYAKGPLISMCLDLELLHLSNGKYGIMELINDLAKSYGKDRAFKDEELIPKIVSLTYPEIKTFFDDYVIGGRPLPFEKVLGYAGIDYKHIDIVRDFSFGKCELSYNPATGRLMVASIKTMNDFGKKLGWQVGDEIDKVNGKKISPIDFRKFRDQWVQTVKEGDKVTIDVLRKSADGKTVKKTILKAKAFKCDVKNYNTVAFDIKPSEEQLKIRKAWLDGAR
jgi:predicted metalloprotease with PDZ domain